MPTDTDATFMARAIELARRGEGFVEPNPMVGAVIVRGGRVLAEGWHRRFGGPHAEVEALRRCGPSPRGATLYVSLEPCCHHGKTPPCTDAIIAAGIRRVVAAVRDPFPRVAGGGFRRLRRAGIDVVVGVRRHEAIELNAPFFKRQRTGRPWVILKWAQSLDGTIATRTGDSKWISSPPSRRLVHALRGRVDAVIVGAGTVRADDPDLTCRDAPRRRTAVRIVLDSRARTPRASRLMRTARLVPTLVVTARSSAAAAARLSGCEVLAVGGAEGAVDLVRLLDELGRRGMTNVLVEGGGRVIGAFFDQNLADEAWVFVAPMLLGGRGASGPLAGRGPATVKARPRWRLVSSRRIGRDLLHRLRYG